MAETVENPSGKEEAIPVEEAKVEPTPDATDSAQKVSENCENGKEIAEEKVIADGVTDKENDDDENQQEEKEEEDGENVVTLEDDGGEEDAIPTVTIPDVVFFDNVTDEEKKYYEENLIANEKVEEMKVNCTACFKQVNHHIANNIQRHPVLGVPLCRNCKHFYEEGDWEKDDEGSDMFCRWCGNGGEVLGCDNCKVHVFCKRCITRNCGRSKFAEINDSDEWSCFTCQPSQIYKERNLMLSIARWAAERKKMKRVGKKDKGTPKKEKLKEDKKRKREEKQKMKHDEEISKVENFIDENIHEAFDTLSVYQKCLEDERRKWIKARKTMNAKNAAMAAKSLRRIYELTRQNMELLDHSLVEGYTAVYPDDADRKLNFNTDPKSPGKRKKKDTHKVESGDDDIEVEGVVINGEAVYANGDGDEEAGMGDFDPSLLCSVEITADRESSSTPTLSTPQGPPRKKKKLGKSTPSAGPASARGQMRISQKFLKKKSPKKIKKKMGPGVRVGSKKKSADGEIEEITIDDDDSVGYVSQTEMKTPKKAAKKVFDDDFDSDVSLE